MLDGGVMHARYRGQEMGFDTDFDQLEGVYRGLQSIIRNISGERFLGTTI